jgi:alpha-galactosidase
MNRWALVLQMGWICCAGVVVAQPQSDLAGAWVTEVTQRTPVPQLLTFNHQGSDWTGTLTSRFGAIELKEIVFRQGHVFFSEYSKGGFGPTSPVRVQGVLHGDELRLEISSLAPGYVERVAHRATPREIAAIKTQELGQTPLTPLPDNGVARTPPMGWNSWNHFGPEIDDKTVREVADALVATGLRDVGYVYVNIDDGWQGERDADGTLHPNSRFPNMKGLTDYVHARGLKFGIYSSPGPTTCDDREGSFGHEEQDAKTFAGWGVDFLKYDWCSANDIYSTPMEMQAAYREMGAALQATGRSILYSLCQYGLIDVGRWGREVGGNSWRTTGDIADYWSRMAGIGFGQNGHEADAGPGGWNDPDMLEVGNGGMTADEYRAHLTLWSMLSAPLLLGNDIRAMTPETKALLMNREVIAIDQDILGIQARRLGDPGPTEVWSKPLADGSVAVALFNKDNLPNEVRVRGSDVGLPDSSVMRDLWAHIDLPNKPEGFHTILPPHASALLRIGLVGSQLGNSEKTSVNLIFIGDSITYGANLSDPEHQAPPVLAAKWVREHSPNLSVDFSNLGMGGHTTVDTLPATNTDLVEIEAAAKEQQFKHPGRLIFSIMLGTNDSAESGPLGAPVSPDEYRANLAALIDRLLADYPTSKLLLNRPLWYSPNTYNGSRYLASGLRRLESYSPQVDSLIAGYSLTHPHRVYRGDTEGFGYFKNHASGDLVAERGQLGVFHLHPNEHGASVLGQLWGKALQRVIDSDPVKAL